MMLRDDLIAARSLIDTPEKWRKDDSTQHDNCCAIIAVERTQARTIFAMYDALYLQIPQSFRTDDEEPGVCVGEYNDAPATTHADIMALFDRAIQAATPEPENKS
jgi:hypothetical protein